MIYSVIAPGMTLPPTSMWSCGKAEFGQIPRSFAANSGAIRLKRPKNLTQIGFPSLRSVKSDRLLARILHEFRWTLLMQYADRVGFS
jgi:hypothetical protein